MAALTHADIRRILEHAGTHPTDAQVESTAQLHNALTEQIARAPAGLLKEAEPYFIQPIRTRRARRAQHPFL